jgi:ABC-type polysaccharide/polyol phosphate transport system ATPase subunit
VIRALDGVSFSLDHGDRVALVGHNGAGKSTLLKVLAGVYEPFAGQINIKGKVSSLFTSIPGLVQDDTGFENIVTCGLFLGMTSEEIKNKTFEIAEFTELGEYLKLPVRSYSSGMLLRLGFAIATSLEPDILILDEGLGAGDARFTDKVNRRMNALLNRSSIVVVASHSNELICAMCNKAILLDSGKLLRIGSVVEILEQYQELTALRHLAS